MKYAIVAKMEWDGGVEIVEEYGDVGKAKKACDVLHKVGRFYRTAVVDQMLRTVYKVERICRCANKQWKFSEDKPGERRLFCIDCGVDHTKLEEVRV